MIPVRFQGKPFNITVIQVYAPTGNTEEAEVERFYENLQDLLGIKHSLGIYLACDFGYNRYPGSALSFFFFKSYFFFLFDRHIPKLHSKPAFVSLTGNLQSTFARIRCH